MSYFPDSGDLAAFLASSFPRASFDSTLFEGALLSAQGELATATRRTWEPIRETRYFTGTGKELLTIDEYLEVFEVQIIRSTPGDVQFSGTDWWEVQKNGFPKNRLSIYQGGGSLVFGFPLRHWPVGVENVEIDATWGYSCEIPADVKQAILYRAASQIINPGSVRVGSMGELRGPLLKWDDGDISASYGEMGGKKPSEWLGWDEFWERTIKRYRRTVTQLQNQRGEVLW